MVEYHRACKKCETEFSTNIRAKEYCSERCRFLAEQKRRWERRPDEMKAKARARYIRNAEKERARGRLYYKANKADVLRKRSTEGYLDRRRSMRLSSSTIEVAIYIQECIQHMSHEAPNDQP